MKRRTLAALAALCCAWRIPPALAQPSANSSIPGKGFNIVNPFPPGSPVEFVGRLVAHALERHWPQQFAVVESRSGAGGTLGANTVVRSEPTGATLLVSTASPITVAAALYEKLPYDPARDLIPIWGVATPGQVVVVNKDLPVKTLAELVAYAKANPGKLSYASSGVGTVQHFAGELFKARTGAPLLHVPYRGGAPAATDLAGGHVHVMFDSLTNQLSNIQTGKVRALAILRAERDSKLTDVPTAAQAGVEGVEMQGWISVFAPGRTPPNVVRMLRETLTRIMAAPDIEAKLKETFGQAQPLTGQQLETMIAQDMKMYAELVKTAGIPKQ
ncbi:MAG: tripartite tricarboxylate transporter substrate binding protein [Burkholderiales bacterium]|nr:tripartite tricarboxylate transporter substrate binding protein [Burkholderiales bacterium]